MQDENALLCEKQQHTCSQWYLEIPSNTKQTSSQFENVTKKRAYTHTRADSHQAENTAMHFFTKTSRTKISYNDLLEIIRQTVMNIISTLG